MMEWLHKSRLADRSRRAAASWAVLGLSVIALGTQIQPLLWVGVLCIATGLIRLLLWTHAIDAGGDLGLFSRSANNLPGMAYRYVRRPDGVGYFSYVSKGCMEVFAVSADQALNDPEAVLGLIDPEDRVRLRETMEVTLYDSRTEWWIGKAKTPDGSSKWITVTAKGCSLPSGDQVWDGIVLDDTRRQAELLESRNFLHSVVENLPDMVFLKDAKDLKFVFLNKAGEELLGFDRDDLIGKSDFDFFPEDQARDFISRDRGVLEGREVVSYMREPITTRSLGTRLLHTKKFPICDTAGEPVYLLGISEDVTDRIHTEEALLASQQQLNAILEHAATPVMLHDLDGRVLLFNENALAMWDRTLPEVIGQPPEAFMTSDAAANYRRAEAVVRTSHQAHETEELVNVNGQELTYITIRFPLVGVNGDVFAVGSIATEITDQKRIMNELAKAKEGAETANLAKSMFLSRMSHELRTPLNAILGFAQLLEYEELTGDQPETVQFILNAGRHLLRLINEVLDISRIESGNFSLSVEAVEVHEVLQEVVSMAKPLADARSISIVVSEVPGDAYVLADRQRLSQALLNLLSNAIKYNQEGGGVNVRWSTPKAKTARIEVSDTGRGIPALMRDRLFVPFDRLGAEASNVEGTGLGLSLSLRLMEAMNGTMGLAHSGPDGSTFYIEIPSTPVPSELYDSVA